MQSTRRSFLRGVSACLTIIILSSVLVVAPAGAQDGSGGGETAQQVEQPAAATERPEIESLRTKYSKTYRESDGTLTAEIANAPIHYRDGDAWRDIDNTLVPCADTTCGWRNAAGAFTAEFPTSLSDTSMVSIVKDDRSFAFGLAGAAKSTAPPVVDGNSITYKDVFPTIDLRYEVRNTLVKELIVLNQAPSRPMSVSFPLKMKGVAARQLPSGEIELVDEAGDVVFTIPLLWMEDSSAGPGKAAARSEAISMTLETRGSSQFITVTPDHGWLTSPERAYPVKVDPVVITGDDEAVRDTFIQSGTGSNGTLDYLKVSGSSGAASPAHTLVKFPNFSSVPSGAVVRASELRLFNQDSDSCYDWRTDIHQVTSDWNESTTWGTKPYFNTSPLYNMHNVMSKTAAYTASACAPSALNFPQNEEPMPTRCRTDGTEPSPNAITKLVRGWIDRTIDNYGLLVKGYTEANTRRKLFRSKESTRPPTLAVNYTLPPQPPDMMNVDTSTGHLTPTLKARYLDPDTETDNGCLRFEILSGSTLVKFAYSLSDGTPSGPGSILPWQVPSGLLNYNTTYTWRVRGFDEWTHGPWAADQTYTTPPPPPDAPVVSSTSHPLQRTWYQSRNASLSWTAPIRAVSYRYQLNGPTTTTSPTCPSAPSNATSTNSTSYSSLQDGRYCFGVAALDGLTPPQQGNAGTYEFWIDGSPPPAPSLTCNPGGATWSTNNSPTYSYAASDLSGIVRYRYEFDQAAGRQGLGTSTTSSSYAPGAQADGIYYFTVEAQNGAGAWSVAAECQSRIDAIASEATVNSTTHPDPTVAYDSDDPHFTWSAVNNHSGTAEYAYKLSTLASGETRTGATVTTATEVSLSNVPRTRQYFWVWVKMNSGAWSKGTPFEFEVRDPGPSIDKLTATPHSDQNAWYADRSPSFSWSGSDPSGVKGYSYMIDGNPDTTPDPSSEGTATEHTPPTPLDDGIHWFHVSGVNNKDVWGEPAHFKVQIDGTLPGEPTGLTSTSHVPNVGFKDRTVDMTWEKPVAPDLSGIKGYSWVFRKQDDTCDRTLNPECYKGAPAPDDGSVMSEGTKAQSLELDAAADDGPQSYWFHVRTVDNAGNVSDRNVTYGPLIIDPQGSPIPLTPTLNEQLVAQSDTNGMEQFYPYRAFDLGTYRGFNNLHSGNLVVRGSDFNIPGKGLNTVIRHTYNAHRDDARYHDSGVGLGWSLSLADADAGLDAALGVIDIDLNAPVVPTSGYVVGAPVGALGGILELTDGDGTVHRFIRRGDPGTRWDSPPGVNLRVREVLDDDPVSPKVVKYELIRPDGVVYTVGRVSVGPTSVSETWHVTGISDRNRNRLELIYEPTAQPPPDVLSKVRLRYVDHVPNGEPERRVATFTYSDSGRLDRITALPGTPDVRTTKFEFYTDYREGHLKSVWENYQGNDERITQFDYLPYERSQLDPTDDVQLLTSVRDGDGKETRFSFDDGSVTGKNRLEWICDRRDIADNVCDETWMINYGQADAATGDRTTRFVTPLGAATQYRISGRRPISEDDPRIAGGNILEITDAGMAAADGTTTRIVDSYSWEENRLVSKTNGTGDRTEMTYNSLGLLTSLTAPPPNAPDSGSGPTARVKTTLTYNGVQGLEEDPKSGCASPTSSGSVTTDLYCDRAAELVRAESAAGTSSSRVTDFLYDAAGNPESVMVRGEGAEVLTQDASGRWTVPSARSADRVTKMTYHAFGGLHTIDGPRAGSDVTTYRNYDVTGMPTSILDAAQQEKTFEFDGFGMVTRIIDRAQRLYKMTYDDRNNMLTSTDPADDTTVYTYDINDNRKTVTAPRGGTTTFHYNDNEWRTKTVEPAATLPDTIVTSQVEYRADGSVDYDLDAVGNRTNYDYYANGLVKRVDAPGASAERRALVDYEYDAAGRTLVERLPGGGGGRPTRSFAYAPAGGVASVTETSATDNDRVTTFVYDVHGAVTKTLGPRKSGDGTLQEESRSYNAFGEMFELKKLVRAGEAPLIYGYAYDEAGNLKSSTQPSGATAEQSLTTRYSYDVLNRLERQTDPQNPLHVTEFGYDAEGNQTARRDYKDANDDGVLIAEERRRVVVTSYTADYDVRDTVATDYAKAGTPTLATCNFDATYPTGYDANGNLLVTRSVKGTTGCDGGDVIRSIGFTYDDRDRVKALEQTVQAPGMGSVTRKQDLTYRPDDALETSTWAGKTTTYDYTPGAYLKTVGDWRNQTSLFTHFANGNTESISLAGDVSASFGYHADGSIQSLVWKDDAGSSVRSHKAITYDIGGLRTGEDVAIVPASPTNVDADTGGTASFSYDLANRLTSWTSPFRLSDNDTLATSTDQPTTTYTLDDGGNITREEVRAGAKTWIERTSTYVRSRLETKRVKTTGLLDLDTTTDIEFRYTPLGEESFRKTSTTVAATTPLTETQTADTSFDPGGHTNKVDNAGDDAPADVDYLYSGDDQLIARTPSNGKTTYFFYFLGGNSVAEETRPSGASKVRYLNTSSGQPLAEQRIDDSLTTGEPDETTTTWVWLLRDPHGSVATELKKTATGTDVIAQRGYDPYGAVDKGGSSSDEATSNLGFQGAYTDKVTDKLVLGPRMYDPNINRFTTADFFVGAGSDMALGTDPLTGNRYMFAGANPVAFYDDGHKPMNAGHEGSEDLRCKPADCGGDEEYVRCYKSDAPSCSRQRNVDPSTSLVLDMIGLVPLLGDAVDGARCAAHALGTANTVDTALMCGSMVPIIGGAATASKALRTGAKLLHGNSRLSDRVTYLYRLYDQNDNYLKTGITSNPTGRYSRRFLMDKRLEFLTSGSRDEMLNLERFIVERDPGPLNFERWVGNYAEDVP